MTSDEVISFWFEEIEQSQWWVKDEQFDKAITERFFKLHSSAIQCELFAWRESSLGALAEIIVLDQFSRNMFRGHAESFAYDSLALSLSQASIAKDLDQELTPEKRSFLYMPFMHSESLQIHDEAEKLFTDLGQAFTLEFEIKHKKIIEKFGRYPHRNEVLGRESSKEELEFLALPGSGF